MELSVRDLACTRGGVCVLEGVSLGVGPGQALVLRGPNGIGKTTLLRTIAGLQKPAAGQISLAPDSLAFAGHLDGLKATLSVAENLGFWAAVHGKPGIEDALVAMNLDGLRNRQAQNLSAGQQRRLGLARLMVTGRPIWLLDEPTVSLDATSAGLFADMIRVHLAAGGAALIATHADLGLRESAVLDLTPFKARPQKTGAESGAFDEAFG
jgi:heme exporter protein A